MAFRRLGPSDVYTIPAGGARVIGSSSTAPQARINSGTEYILGTSSTFVNVPIASGNQYVIPGGWTITMNSTSGRYLNLETGGRG